jgi:hypothetical protein
MEPHWPSRSSAMRWVSVDGRYYMFKFSVTWWRALSTSPLILVHLSISNFQFPINMYLYLLLVYSYSPYSVIYKWNWVNEQSKFSVFYILLGCVVWNKNNVCFTNGNQSCVSFCFFKNIIIRNFRFQILICYQSCCIRCHNIFWLGFA